MAEAGAASAAWREDVSDLFALGVFRLVPHLLKRHVYDAGEWRIPRLYPPRKQRNLDDRIAQQSRTDLGVFDQLTRTASADAKLPQVRYMHFFGVHYPSTLSRTCGYVGVRKPAGRPVALETTHCILSRLFEYLWRLDELGIYDSSLIFVVADHGHIHIPFDATVTSLPAQYGIPPAAGEAESSRLDRYSRGIPTFLVKPIGDRGPLRISDRPVSLCDVPNSVFDALGFEEEFACESLFSDQLARNGPRIHYRHLSNAEPRRLPVEKRVRLMFDKYAVEGHSWLPRSWHPIEVHER